MDDQSIFLETIDYSYLQGYQLLSFGKVSMDYLLIWCAILLYIHMSFFYETPVIF